MMRRSSKFGSAVAMALGVLATCSFAHADIITWQSSVDLIAGGNNDAFISTNGTPVLAFSGGVPTTGFQTVNTVDFFNIDSAGLMAGFTGGGVTVSSDTFSNQAGPTTFGDGEFSGNVPLFNTIAGAVFDGGNPAAGDNSITFNGLTVGQIYEIQVLVNDARGGTNAGIRDTEWEVGFTDGVTNLIAAEADLTNRPFNDSTSGAVVGDFIIGTFTANSTTKSFNIGASRGGLSVGDDVVAANINNGQAQINALQLRDLGTAVPEPSSLAILSLMGLGMSVRRRK